MTFLSLYCHHNQCQVALKTGNHLYAQTADLNAGITQAMALMPLIQQVWRQVGSPKIDTIITARGPGSFTSLRVTLATAQGLAVAFPEAKIFAPTHFEVLGYAAQQSHKGPVLVLIDSKRGDWYGQLYPSSQSSEIQIFKAEDLRLFLDKNPACRLIADFDIEEEFQSYLIKHPHNLAVTQLELFEDKNFDSLRINPTNQQLKPYYYYQPAYVKKR